MTEPAREKISRELAVPQDGKGARVKKPGERYCAFCGEEAKVHALSVERFGEVFCSDGHAEEFVKEVRAARVEAAALRATEPAAATERPEQPGERTPQQPDWKRYLKLGACCGLPLLALVVLAGGGGAVLGAAGALLPLLALLACPIGMYFMMRKMGKAEHRGNPDDTGGGKPGGSPGR